MAAKKKTKARLKSRSKPKESWQLKAPSDCSVYELAARMERDMLDQGLVPADVVAAFRKVIQTLDQFGVLFQALDMRLRKLENMVEVVEIDE